ncbi:hypothetical protein F511_06486 [Dorcoceras hygrometricum]|uniref:Uncharacterized protein n=1 Tax=Dorcoceras hygrometricum TaxID=472368 RepID=A0A2Z7D1L2_9LAMI|nr:hypothetical protein F511_06486 [Dorcoceras hygrometricum]
MDSRAGRDERFPSWLDEMKDFQIGWSYRLSSWLELQTVNLILEQFKMTDFQAEQIIDSRAEIIDSRVEIMDSRAGRVESSKLVGRDERFSTRRGRGEQVGSSVLEDELDAFPTRIGDHRHGSKDVRSHPDEGSPMLKSARVIESI